MAGYNKTGKAVVGLTDLQSSLLDQPYLLGTQTYIISVSPKSGEILKCTGVNLILRITI